MNNTKNICAAAALLLTMSCNNNPLLEESPLFGGAPQFDKIKPEHYMPAFKAGIEEGKAEIDAIVACKEEPSFENTIEALEYAGRTFDRVGSIFYNILEADSSDELQQIAEDVSPLANEYEMYISLNDKLFERVRAVYDKRESLGLEPDQMRLLEKTYKGFVRGGANLSPEDKAIYSDLNEKLSLARLKFGKNVLAANNAYTMVVDSEDDLAGLPGYVVESAAQAAKEKGVEGWVFDLSAPSYVGFMKYSERRELRKQLYLAYNTRAADTNAEVVKEIAGLRLQIAQLLGYSTYADYALEQRMVKNRATVTSFISELLDPSLPKAKKEVADICAWAKKNGFEDSELRAWDFSYWSERYKNAFYAINESDLKPYLQLDSCINAVFGLATRLYGLQFTQRPDLPVYQEDVRVYDVRDEGGEHLALLYVDFFPRSSKRSGAWMTEFSSQRIENGKEYRPVISLVTNFSKPTSSEPSLLTHSELETFLHEFGHSLHGMMAQGRYPSLCGTNVSLDFVELPSQIMENWAFEPEFLQGFAINYKTGEVMPEELIKKVEKSRNYLSAYAQVRQLQFGIIDMAWHSLTDNTAQGVLWGEGETLSVIDFERNALKGTDVIAREPQACTSTSITHLFSGGYASGYYSYKWAEVLEADAFSLFKEKGIFSREVASSFRDNVLSRGSSEDEAVLYRNFRGHDPQTGALLEKLGITSK